MHENEIKPEDCKTKFCKFFVAKNVPKNAEIYWFSSEGDFVLLGHGMKLTSDKKSIVIKVIPNQAILKEELILPITDVYVNRNYRFI